MVEILLSVYNGEKYLNEQLDSILNQTYKNFVIKIRNDGSKDESQKIIDYYCQRFPDKIININKINKNVGLVESLNILLSTVKYGNYIMFSDQDDFWFRDKIEVSLKEIKKHENKNKNIPVMICSDASCTNSNLEIIANSFSSYQKLPIDNIKDVNKLAALNVIQGSTIMTNYTAYQYFYPMPLIMKIHDMWIGLNCLYYGHLVYIRKPLLYYRQHQDNVVGSSNITIEYYLKRLSNLFTIIKFYYNLKKNLTFKISLFKILLFKIIFMIKRI